MALLAESRLPTERVTLLRWAVVALFILLLTGFWQLQVVRSDFYSTLAERNRIRTVPVMAPRGMILDREGRPLVTHYTSFSVVFIREYAEQVQQDLPRIARGLELEPEWLERRLQEAVELPPYQPIVLKDEATMADIAFIEAHRTDLPELELLLVYRRRYPDQGYGAHLFGYVGEATKREVEAEEYELGDFVGKMGVERRYNEILMGVNGQRRVIVDSRGKEVARLDRLKPVAGKPVRLTLDADLQRTAELAMEGHQGALVALDPRTGEILAAVSRPAFDPNLFAVRIRPDDWRGITEDPAKPLLNRVIQAQLAPGSVFKVVVATAALEESVINKDTFRVTCPGWANHYGRTFRCWVPNGHGVVDLHKAIVQSCDVFFYEVGRRLGIEQLSRYAKLLGLGAPTGIDLPSEERGLVPSPEWKQRVQKQPWWDGETINVAIGQGPLLVTPLQLAYAYGGIASGGVFARPHLLLNENQQPEIHRVNLKPSTVSTITAALWGVVNEDGTARSARLPDVPVGGKTGTAQLVSLETLGRLRQKVRTLTDNAWFVGLAPQQDPEIVVAVLLEHGQHGASAAPLAREVIRVYFEKKQKQPAAPGSETATGRPASATAQAAGER
ncbi:MAG: penicillin-binding protein 2 [Candidatus Acidiferrales bacterium]